MSSSSDENKLMELLKIIGKSKDLTEVLENEILCVFDKRGENAVKVLKKNNLHKLILDENIHIWQVKGRSKSYIVIEDNSVVYAVQFTVMPFIVYPLVIIRNIKRCPDTVTHRQQHKVIVLGVR